MFNGVDLLGLLTTNFSLNKMYIIINFIERSLGHHRVRVVTCETTQEEAFLTLVEKVTNTFASAGVTDEPLELLVSNKCDERTIVELMRDKSVDSKIDGEHNPADFFTKLMGPTDFEKKSRGLNGTLRG